MQIKNIRRILIRYACFMTAFLFLPLIPGISGAESTPEPIPEPTLSPDGKNYDPEFPENLTADNLYALSAILMTQDTGEVVFEKDPDTIRYPASTTKIMTVLLGILFVDDLYQTVTVSDQALAIPDDSSTMHLQPGEEIRFIDVLYGTMLLSGNDGANVIAETVSGTIPRFVDLMNETAQMMGCTQTHFANPHGYHEEDHYSTARDLCIIARQAMSNEIFREIAGAVTYQIPKTNKQRARTITTKSEYMLTGSEAKPNQYYYPYATGVKTGSHSMSGYCFVGSATKDNIQLVSVVLFTGRRARWADTIKLMNYGFSQYMSVNPVELFNMNPVTIETSSYSTSDTARGRIQLVCQAADPAAAEYRITATRSEIQRMADRLTDTMRIQYSRDFIAPVTAGEIMGTMIYYPPKGDPLVYTLTASRSVSRRENAPKTLQEIILDTYNDPNPYPPVSVELVLVFLAPGVILGGVILLVVLIRKHRKKHPLNTPHPGRRYLK